MYAPIFRIEEEEIPVSFQIPLFTKVIFIEIPGLGDGKNRKEGFNRITKLGELFITHKTEMK